MTSRRKNRRALLFTLLAVLLTGILSFGDDSPLRSAWSAVTGGIFNLSANAAAQLDSPSTEELLDENNRLKSENAALQKALADSLELKDENRTLWSYFGLKKNAPGLELKPAFVSRRAPTDDFGGFSLGAGSDLGVRTGDAVICESGLVGRVISTDSFSCRVATLLSPGTRVAAIDGETSDSGIVEGHDGSLVMTQLSESSRVKTGDMILTSGDGGVYPPRIIIGRVAELKTDPSDASSFAVLEPAADFEALTEAAVVISFTEKGVVGSE
ncbi:rod shape-determining protein MreC [Lachnoclostridium sp. MSJ-17]|uniref:rod shape-determining protein MreC n=1 Tax=Lachnoclostridium sp. MSJ-17 TaxID=2841516 RepID=UPI001C118F8E|nr:rod shape-determining protein MreC [Lachnoclostridium sp. MSJ-17]MBU5462350.1 rod shape-determining protein MreC [Lachnoclostridium sp. MSJ-17]